MSEKFLNDRGLNNFYKGLKTKFLKYNETPCNTYIDGRVKNYLESAKFNIGSGVTDLNGYIRYIVTEMMSSDIVGNILDSRYDDVKVFDFYTMYEACSFYIDELTSSLSGKTDEEVDTINEYIGTLTTFRSTVAYGSISDEDDFNEKYETLSTYITDYVPSNVGTVGNAFTIFPYRGVEDAIYVDNNTGIQYVWDNLERKYLPTAQPISQQTLDSIF